MTIVNQDLFCCETSEQPISTKETFSSIFGSLISELQSFELDDSELRLEVLKYFLFSIIDRLQKLVQIKSLES